MNIFINSYIIYVGWARHIVIISRADIFSQSVAAAVLYLSSCLYTHYFKSTASIRKNRFLSTRYRINIRIYNINGTLARE